MTCTAVAFVDNTFTIKIVYLLASVLFILGLRNMAHPRTAVRGNLLGATGMLLAVVVTLFDNGVASFSLIVVGMIIGSVVGVILATRIQMTAMPQLVAIFNGLGGIASALVAGAALANIGQGATDALVATAISGIIGAITFWGSLVAFAKLQEWKTFKQLRSFQGQQIINTLLLLLLLALSVWMINGQPVIGYVVLVLVASLLGVLLVMPIGGADMPVVIAVLNSYSGLAAAATGFVIDNNILIIAGSLVGASGIILTKIMCRAMNRSLTNVLFGVMETGTSQGDADEIYSTVRSTSPEDVAMILDAAQSIVIVPGYGMAVAQAQHAVRDLANLLQDNQAQIEYAIHPVAGRMPGHMNVLLAEADVPYHQLKELDDINPTMSSVDVAIVIGANDVVNPVAKTEPDSPIAGMPIIDVIQARTVIVIKRSLSPGFAGIPNPLFAADNTLMLFGDGKQALLDIISAVKEG